MALKRTVCPGWTKGMSHTQRAIGQLNKSGQFDQAQVLHSHLKDAHRANVSAIRRNSGRGS